MSSHFVRESSGKGAMPSTVKTTLVVGIDFGTTFSGVSWLVYKDGSAPSQPEVISLWKTSHDNRLYNSDRKKVPSKIYYDKNGELSWGFNIPAGVESIEWFKLLLLDEKGSQDHLQDSSHLSSARKALSKLDKSAIEVVRDYLKALWNHALEQIYDAKGKTLIDGMPIQVVLTVPAIWPDHTVTRMRVAANLAGILNPRLAGPTKLSFITEPEAAAIATLLELDGRGDLEVGDSFVLVDAGGGTVDIISYKINAMEPLSISECVEGDGALCGGTFLDQEFETFLKTTAGRLDWLKMSLTDIRRLMNTEWGTWH